MTAASERAKIVAPDVSRLLDVVLRNREAYVTAWIAETGLLPSESMLVEQRFHEGTTVRTEVRVVPRTGCPFAGCPSRADAIERGEHDRNEEGGGDGT